MELAVGVLFVVAMFAASKGIKAPTDAAHVVRLHNGESGMQSGNFWLALGLMVIVAVIGIAMVGGAGGSDKRTDAAHVDTWSHNQINIASDVRNVTIASDAP